MLKKPPYGLFVTGTDTEVGKTYVATQIARDLIAAGHRVGVYKPVASDCVSDGRQLVSEDAVALWDAANRPLTLDAVCPQRFQAPLAPHLSARQEGREIDTELIRNGISAWTDECDVVVVEGAGGLMSPISDDEYIADVAYDLGYPLIVVTPNAIGAINQTLSALITANCFRDGLNVAGVILNDSRMFDGDSSMESNRDQIQSRAMSPVLSRLRYEGQQFDEPVDWMALARQTETVDSDA
ncbi:MAG: dethiobiotin synthetase [Mariniblastus sp.]|jgi:dethiobiotin synthetase